MTILYIFLFSLIPAGIGFLGGLISSVYVPKEKLTSLFQHFVAGIVIGAVAIDLLPKILGKAPIWSVALGFILGVILMLSLHEFAHAISRKGKKEAFPYGLVVASGLDLFIDGILIGVSFLAGKQSGILIALALSLCAFFLTLTVSATLTQKAVSKGVQLFSIFIIVILLPIGALVGSAVISQFPKIILTETLAFGVAALLHLGCEELLGEAHTEHETPWITSSFFLGFLVILLLRV